MTIKKFVEDAGYRSSNTRIVAQEMALFHWVRQQWLLYSAKKIFRNN
jgi:hypothetical protein